MQPILQSQIFFFISSVGFIILGILAIFFFYYLIRAAKTFSKVMDKVDKDIEKIGDTTKEMLEEVKHSLIFNFLFRRKRKHHRD